MVWEMEITEKQKRKEMKRRRKEDRGKKVKAKSSESGDDGCEAPVFLLSRGIQFDRSGERSSIFAPGTKLILRCEGGATPFPKTRAKCRCHEETCAWSKLHKTQCLKLEHTTETTDIQ